MVPDEEADVDNGYQRQRWGSVTTSDRMRLELGVSEPQTVTERELLQMFRDSSATDRTMLWALLNIWPAMDTAHRGIVYRVADALMVPLAMVVRYELCDRAPKVALNLRSCA